MNENLLSDLYSQITAKVNSTQEQEGGFSPSSILKHLYIPIEYVLVSEVGNDLDYTISYWELERLWKVHLNEKKYDRAISVLLQEKIVIVDYTDCQNLRVLIPSDQKCRGFEDLYKETLETLRSVDKEGLQEFLSSNDTMVRLGWQLA